MLGLGFTLLQGQLLPEVNLLSIARHISIPVEQYPAPSLTTKMSFNMNRVLEFEHAKNTHVCSTTEKGKARKLSPYV